MIGIIADLMARQEARKDFEEYLLTLSDEEAQELRAERNEANKIEAEHNRALEIAEASRPRNFWGN